MTSQVPGKRGSSLRRNEEEADDPAWAEAPRRRAAQFFHCLKRFVACIVVACFVLACFVVACFVSLFHPFF